jgi:hypothetical protein
MPSWLAGHCRRNASGASRSARCDFTQAKMRLGVPAVARGASRSRCRFSHAWRGCFRAPPWDGRGLVPGNCAALLRQLQSWFYERQVRKRTGVEGRHGLKNHKALDLHGGGKAHDKGDRSVDGGKGRMGLGDGAGGEERAVGRSGCVEWSLEMNSGRFEELLRMLPDVSRQAPTPSPLSPHLLPTDLNKCDKRLPCKPGLQHFILRRPSTSQTISIAATRPRPAFGSASQVHTTRPEKSFRKKRQKNNNHKACALTFGGALTFNNWRICTAGYPS